MTHIAHGVVPIVVVEAFHRCSFDGEVLGGDVASHSQHSDLAVAGQQQTQWETPYIQTHTHMLDTITPTASHPHAMHSSGDYIRLCITGNHIVETLTLH